MSDSTSTQPVKQNSDDAPDFYQLIVGDKASLLYPVKSIDTVLFIDALKDAGWTAERRGNSVHIYAPEKSNLVLYIGRVA